MLKKSKSKLEHDQDYYVELDIEHWPDREFKKILKKWQVSLIVLSRLDRVGRTEIRLYGLESNLEGLLQETDFDTYASLPGQIRSVGAV